LEAEAEAPEDVDDPVARVLVVAGLEVAVFAGAVTEVTGVVPVVVPTAVVVPVPVPVAAEVPEEVRQAVSVLDWTVNAADWARVPVLSRRFRPREVPAVTLTTHVSELPVC
jgi:hypothetical protein